MRGLWAWVACRFGHAWEHLRGWRTAILSGVTFAAGVADVLPAVRDIIPEGAYKWLMILSAGAFLLVRHATDGPPAWKKTTPGGPASGPLPVPTQGGAP